MKNAYRASTGKSERNRSFGTPLHKWEDVNESYTHNTNV
jgi:hypothetical protein